MKKLELVLCLILILVFAGFLYYLGSIQGREGALMEKGKFKPRIDTTWVWTPEK